MKMAELSLLPSVRAAGNDTLLIANGASSWHQIHDATGRESQHIACILQDVLQVYESTR